MKKYLVYSTLSFMLISLTVDYIFSGNNGYQTLKSFNWLVSYYGFNVILILIQGLVLSLLAAVYIEAKNASVDGFRFGLMAGLTVIMVELFIMLILVNDGMYAFFSDSLLTLLVIQVMAYSVSGYIFGWLYNAFLQNEINELPYSFFPEENSESEIKTQAKDDLLVSEKNKGALKRLNQWHSKFNVHG